MPQAICEAAQRCRAVCQGFFAGAVLSRPSTQPNLDLCSEATRLTYHALQTDKRAPSFGQW